MTLLDSQTTRLESPLAAPHEATCSTDYFTFLAEFEPAATESAALDELEFAPFDIESGLADYVAARSVRLAPDEIEAESRHTDLTTAYARCSDGAGTLTHLFFSDDNFDLARAKAICGKCRLAPTCLADAVEREESYGVWGGELLVNGLIVAVKRGRGRPPKHQVVLSSVEEVPLPPHMVA